MQENGYRWMHKGIGDAAWNQLVAKHAEGARYTAYKAEYAGRECVLVDPGGTSQECSGCGEEVPKDLSVRVHECAHCNCVLDRDLNASLNIVSRWLARLGALASCNCTQCVQQEDTRTVWPVQANP
jgi:putative transposase